MHSCRNHKHTHVTQYLDSTECCLNVSYHVSYPTFKWGSSPFVQALEIIDPQKLSTVRYLLNMHGVQFSQWKPNSLRAHPTSPVYSLLPPLPFLPYLWEQCVETVDFLPLLNVGIVLRHTLQSELVCQVDGVGRRQVAILELLNSTQVHYTDNIHVQYKWFIIRGWY